MNLQFSEESVQRSQNTKGNEMIVSWNVLWNDTSLGNELGRVSAKLLFFIVEFSRWYKRYFGASSAFNNYIGTTRINWDCVSHPT